MKLWTSLLDVVGIGCIVAGVCLVSVPAALIVGGLSCLAISWRWTA